MGGRFQSLRCSRVLPTCNKHCLSVRMICPPLLGNGTSVKARADRSVVVELVFKGVLHLVHTNNEWCGLALCERWLIVQCVGGHKAPYAKINGRTNGVGMGKPTNRFGPFDCQSEIPTFEFDTCTGTEYLLLRVGRVARRGPSIARRRFDLSRTRRAQAPRAADTVDRTRSVRIPAGAGPARGRGAARRGRGDG